MNFSSIRALSSSLSSGNSDSHSAVAKVYHDLRRRIISLELPPDTTLSRVKLTQEYNVSQTPMREALQRLEREKLIKIFPQSRTVVTRIDEQQMVEASFLRVALESEVMHALAQNCNASVLSTARSIIRMQQAISEEVSQVSLFYELDEAFHETLFSGAGQSNLHQLLKLKSANLGRIRRLGPPAAGKFELILKGHSEIVDGIESGVITRAVKAIRSHLSETASLSRIEELREDYPDYFESTKN